MSHKVFLSLAVTLLLFLSSVFSTQLPAPKGPFEIGTATFQLTDPSRLDPFAPSPQNRSVQLSIHYPTENGSSLPFSIYLPTITAMDLETTLEVPNGTVQNISTHAHVNATFLGNGNNPVILFSPGFGICRLF